MRNKEGNICENELRTQKISFAVIAEHGEADNMESTRDPKRVKLTSGPDSACGSSSTLGCSIVEKKEKSCGKSPNIRRF